MILLFNEVSKSNTLLKGLKHIFYGLKLIKIPTASLSLVVAIIFHQLGH